MASFNKVILMGRLTAAPELKSTQNGTTVTSFNIAVDRKGKDAPCDFITIVAWKQTAEFVCKYFGKGQAILVCGELQTRSWTDNNGNKRTATEVLANEVTFCESKKESESNNTPSYNPYTTPNFEDVKSDIDLPF